MSDQSTERRKLLPGIAILATGLIIGLAAGALILQAPPLPRLNIFWNSLANLIDQSRWREQRPFRSASDAGGGGDPLPGQRAPNFTLRTLDGNEITLSDLRGQAVLINFWTTWCGPCRLEMPELVRIYQANKAGGFVILALNLTAQDSLPDVKAFAEEFELPFPVLLDETGEVSTDLYQLRGLPTSVFVDRKGRIARIYLGAMTGEQIDRFVTELLQ